MFWFSLIGIELQVKLWNAPYLILRKLCPSLLHFISLFRRYFTVNPFQSQQSLLGTRTSYTWPGISLHIIRPSTFLVIWLNPLDYNSWMEDCVPGEISSNLCAPYTWSIETKNSLQAALHVFLLVFLSYRGCYSSFDSALQSIFPPFHSIRVRNLFDGPIRVCLCSHLSIFPSISNHCVLMRVT